jgi:hypothetical protein
MTNPMAKEMVSEDPKLIDSTCIHQHTNGWGMYPPYNSIMDETN